MRFARCDNADALLTRFVDERQRTVLELSSKDTLRVHVRELLDLERSFQAGRVLVSSAHDEQRALSRDRRCQLLDIAVQSEDVSNLSGKLVQSVDDGVPALGKRNAVLAKLQRHHDQGNVLRCVGL